jgi:hypothetical protein
LRFFSDAIVFVADGFGLVGEFFDDGAARFMIGSFQM